MTVHQTNMEPWKVTVVDTGYNTMTGGRIKRIQQYVGNEPTFGPGLQPYDFIYVDDLLEAVYRLGVSVIPKSFYYIGSGHPRILKEYLIRIGELFGTPDKISIGVRPDDGITYTQDMFDNSELVKAIGEYVGTDFDEGISKTIDWLKSL